MAEYHIFFWFAAGAVNILSGNTLRNKHQRLSENGQAAQGIITSADDWQFFLNDYGIHRYSVRFVTEDKRWISKEFTTLIERSPELDNPVDRYQAGDTVNILYNSTNPEDFIVDSFASPFWATVTMFLGAGCISYSAWLAYHL